MKFGNRNVDGRAGGARTPEAEQPVDESPVDVVEPVAPIDPVDTTPDADSVFTREELDTFVFLLQIEKLAGDLYDAFYDATGLRIFDRISTSEDGHILKLISQAEEIGLDVSDILLLPDGVFADPTIQEIYDSLVIEGSVSTEAALEIAVMLESKDIGELTEAVASVEGTVLEDVYEQLIAGSTRHLDAFDNFIS